MQLNPNIIKLFLVVFGFGLFLLALTYIGPFIGAVAIIALVVWIAWYLWHGGTK